MEFLGTRGMLETDIKALERSTVPDKEERIAKKKRELEEYSKSFETSEHLTDNTQ